MSSSYEDPGADFGKQTFISKIGIYDEQQNLIAVASLANPVKKKEDQKNVKNVGKKKTWVQKVKDNLQTDNTKY